MAGETKAEKHAETAGWLSGFCWANLLAWAMSDDVTFAWLSLAAFVLAIVYRVAVASLGRRP